MSNVSPMVNAVETSSLADKAYYAIREMIVSLEFRPGAVINERALTERLRIGRTPTREALRRLAQEKLVEVYPRRGMFVTSVEIGDLASLCEVRAVLESHAARLAAERLTEPDRAELGGLIAALGEPPAGERALMALDERIHRVIYRLARNPFLEETLEEYYVLALRIWYLALDQARELRGAVQEHRALLAAVCSGEATRAEELMRAHVDGFERAMRAALLGD
ncbi:MAG: GntR family transcriptional regulator [Gaiellaceae bacterium]